tara:strand:- start:273 stop:491 length:219 start_codon:yes stop_codon:yes gene_type:complete
MRYTPVHNKVKEIILTLYLNPIAIHKPKEPITRKYMYMPNPGKGCSHSNPINVKVNCGSIRVLLTHPVIMAP